MVILHIAKISNNVFRGVCVAIPQHIRSQSKYANIGFINISNEKIDGVKNQFNYNRNNLLSIPFPFNKPDLVVFHEIYYFDYIYISICLKKADIPYIIVPHGSLTKEAQKIKRFKKKLANILFFNSFINGALSIQCLSKNEEYNTVFGKNKFIGSNGVYINDGLNKKFNNTIVTFTYIGRLEPYTKGMDLLLQAVSLISEKLRKKKIVVKIYGPKTNNWYKQIESMILEYSISDLVKLNSPVIDDEKRKILLSSDIFIQTSRSEGLPMGILEAMALGIPCLITKGTTLGDYIDSYDAGWVAENDVNDIASKIIIALEDKKKWHIKSNNAFRLVEREFQWDKISKQTVNKYIELIGKIKK